ncbi:hypothetical protein NM688_g9268 [Phlebia brevispora]|uniref:Uncharacterized protein n=1 Tax=Phlebia brevispora TaxID=194682 RepID=A0ACC1RL23_9APHY|nr:hypothetical protein NM688_g9268 [Phlebia brevispora]
MSNDAVRLARQCASRRLESSLHTDPRSSARCEPNEQVAKQFSSKKLSTAASKFKIKIKPARITRPWKYPGTTGKQAIVDVGTGSFATYRKLQTETPVVDVHYVPEWQSRDVHCTLPA